MLFRSNPELIQCIQITLIVKFFCNPMDNDTCNNNCHVICIHKLTTVQSNFTQICLVSDTVAVFNCTCFVVPHTQTYTLFLFSQVYFSFF